MFSYTACPDKSGKSRLAGKTSMFLLLFCFPFFSAHSQVTINVPADQPTIQAGINAASDGDIVLVAEDTYYENINFNGKAITVASHFLLDQDTSHISNTIIDGSLQCGSVVLFISGEDTTSVLYGFTITGGISRHGGGIHCFNSGVKIVHNKIVENRLNTLGACRGAGVFVGVDDTSQYWIVIENNVISNNSGAGSGGGIFMEGTNGNQNGRISNNIIEQNSSGSIYGPEGGGITIFNCSPLISNNIITGNKSDLSSLGYGSAAGGISFGSSNSILINNLITNIFAKWGGGICIGEDAQPIITNNTIVNNTAEDIGGGIFLKGESIIMNSMIWGNTAPTGSQIFDYTDSLEVYFSDIQDGWYGTGNIDVYPEFVDTANGEYHLSNNSPCIGAGIDSLEIAGTWYYCPLTDLERNPRPNPPGIMPDMGAYESPLSVSGIEDHFFQIPKEYFLEQNYPNPFNPNTKIRYSVPQSSNVVIKVFDILGNAIETLVDEEKTVGTYEVGFSVRQNSILSLSSGIYFYQLRVGSFVETKKMLLLK